MKHILQTYPRKTAGTDMSETYGDVLPSLRHLANNHEQSRAAALAAAVAQ